MIIKKLKLVNFRNYSKVDLNFGCNMNIFIGENASGKTNIIESLVVLSLTKSYKNISDSDLIKFSKKKSKIIGYIQCNNYFKNLEIEITEKEKQVKLNNTRIYCLANYISNLNIIIFKPDDLELIKGSPNIRRNLLNMELSQLSPLYLNTYNQYNKILKTRNEYLKVLFTNNIADKRYFDILTEQLIEKAVIIYKLRKEYLDTINKNINIIFKNITSEEKLSILYKPNIFFSDYENDSLKQTMNEILSRNYQRELQLGMTLFGPHRDDFQFQFNGMDMKLFSSQGQQKSAVLSYKLSIIPIFEEKNGTKPVLLLDDIFSELDLKKRNRLLKYVNQGIQSIITTTDLKNISKNSLKNATIFKVSNGNVERSNN